MPNYISTGAKALTATAAVAAAVAVYDAINPTTELASLAAFTVLGTGVIFASNNMASLTQSAIDLAGKGNKPMKYLLIGTSLGLAAFGTSRIGPPLLDLTAYVVSNIIKPLLIVGAVGAVVIGTTMLVVARNNNNALHQANQIPQQPSVVIYGNPFRFLR